MGEERPAAEAAKVRCEACGAKVRIPAGMARERARCPRCRSPLDGRVDVTLPKSIANYRITKRLAAGGMGVVFQGVPSQGGAPVAVKVLQDEAEEEENLVLRFEREGKLGMALHHPGLVRVLEMGEEDGKRYLIMELIEGQSLSRLVKRRGPISWRRAVAIMRELIPVIRFLDIMGVVHRDLKPGNILVNDDGVRLIDFGLAKSQAPELLNDESDLPILTLAGDQLGTPSYMAPEQVEDSLMVTAAADIYGLAASLYFALSGRPPYEGNGSLDVMERVLAGQAPRLRQHSSSIPEAVDELIQWCMAREPSDRPTFDQLDELLDLVEADPDDGAAIRDRRRESGFRPPWGLLFVIVGVLVVGAAITIAVLLLG